MPAFAFNPVGHTPRFDSAGGLPIGQHPVVIIESDFKPTSKGTGTMLILNVQAIDGPAKGGTQKVRLNVANDNATAVKIAMDQLAAIAHVVGKGASGFQVTEELHNIPFIVEIGMQTGSEQYTEVKAIFDINGNKPGQASPAAASVAAQTHAQYQQAAALPPQLNNGFQPATGGTAQTATAGATPPWAKK